METRTDEDTDETRIPYRSGHPAVEDEQAVCFGSTETAPGQVKIRTRENTNIWH